MSNESESSQPENLSRAQPWPLVLRSMRMSPLFEDGASWMRAEAVWCGEGCPDMDNGNAVVKPLVTRASDDVEDNTFVKSVEEAPLFRRRAPIP